MSVLLLSAGYARCWSCAVLVMRVSCMVSPSYDFSNIAPRFVSFRTGGLITGVIGIAIQPWRLLSDPHVYIFTWLGFYGGLLGTIAGVLIAGYWVRWRTSLSLGSLYTPDGRYWFAGGWNWRAVAATAAGAVLSVGGTYTAPGTGGPFPASGLIPALKPLYDYSWVVGLGTGFAVYLLLSLPVFGRPDAPKEQDDLVTDVALG